MSSKNSEDGRKKRVAKKKAANKQSATRKAKARSQRVDHYNGGDSDET